MDMPLTTSGVFPLSMAYLPSEKVLLRIFEDRYLQMFEDILNHDSSFVSVLISQGSEVGGGDRRFSYGVLVNVEKIHDSDVGLIVEGKASQRVEIVEWTTDIPYPKASWQSLSDIEVTQDQIHEAASSISLLAQRIRTLHAMIDIADTSSQTGSVPQSVLTTIAGGRWWANGISKDEVNRAFWNIAVQLPCGAFDRYELLARDSITQRVSQLRNMIDHVTEIIAFQQQN